MSKPAISKQKSFIEVMRSQKKYADPAMREIAKGSLKEEVLPSPSAKSPDAVAPPAKKIK